jgi:hypothetical protein
MFSVPSGKPGVLTTYTATPREIFLANRQFAQFIAAPLTIDGNLSGNALNEPYDWLLFAGTLLGRVTASGKYAPTILGLTSAAYAHTGGSNTTVTTDVNTAKELVRRIGNSGTFKLTGPPAAAGTVAVQTITFSAVNTATGAITITASGADAIAGSLIQPTDGSETIVTLLCDAWGKKVADQLNSMRVDVFDAQLLAAGGTINTAVIANYPTDSSLKAWVKAGLKTTCPGVNFSDDFA